MSWPAKVPAHLAAGWYIEKGDGSRRFGPVNRELWDWPRLEARPACLSTLDM
jgi:hypothetical protein